MISFNKASITKLEEYNVVDALYNSKLSGDGKYTMKVYDQMKSLFGIDTMLLTTSGTTALEMASILINLEPGDEVIVPSFTFSSTVNAFLLRRAVPVFCDIRPDTFNIDETLIEDLITPKTKAIYCVDYAGIPCEMDTINEIANRHGLFVIEDAAQAIGSTYKGRYAGTLSEFGCYSFHETKNYVMGEGGGLVLNEKKYLERAEIIREKGTNRRQLMLGMVDKYTWHDVGSSFLPSDLLASILSAQLDRFYDIMDKRMDIWNTYQNELHSLEVAGKLQRLVIPQNVKHNAHMFNIILPSEQFRAQLGERLKTSGITAPICYVPLHSSPMGQKLGWNLGDCPITEDLGARTLRLPLYAGLKKEHVAMVIKIVKENL